MNKVYIRVEKDTLKVEFIHYMPFDPIVGLNKTEEELLKDGYIVEQFDIPEGRYNTYDRVESYFDIEKNEIYYKITPNVEIPDSEKINSLIEENKQLGKSLTDIEISLLTMGISTMQSTDDSNNIIYDRYNERYKSGSCDDAQLTKLQSFGILTPEQVAKIKNDNSISNTPILIYSSDVLS